MSLDVYLTVDKPITKNAGSGIFVRQSGATKEITLEEWQELHPGQEPVTYRPDGDAEDFETCRVFEYNITHNLGKMAEAAGIYKALWRPEEIGITKASQLPDVLCEGLRQLLGHPAKFKAMNPSNGWGDYDGLVRFVVAYIIACNEYPEAKVSVSR